MSGYPIEIDVSEVQRLLGSNADFYFLDCRGVDEHAIAKIPGAELIPMPDLPTRVGELDDHRERQIVVHCHHGGRSLRVAQWLRQQGFDRAQSMAGGIDAWSLQVDPSVPRY